MPAIAPASVVRFQLISTPARRTVDLFFDGKPDLDQIRAAVAEQELAGAHVRVRWIVASEDRHEVDRNAIALALSRAAEVQLEGRIVPIVRSRAAGISRSASLEEKVLAWARVTATQSEPLLACLAQLAHLDPEQIAARVLDASAGDGAEAEAEPVPAASVTIEAPSRVTPVQAERELELF